MTGTIIAVAVHAVIELAVIIRVMLRPHREPASRIAWIAVVFALPVVGIIAYVLLGETNIGRRRMQRLKQTREILLSLLPAQAAVVPPEDNAELQHLQQRYLPLFLLGQSVNGFAPADGNSGQLMKDSNAGIDAMVADMDDAKEHIHLVFYIWLQDNNGLKVVEALERAARRGVTCRAMMDGLGSRAMVHSKSWKSMAKAGVRLGVALPVGNPLLRPLRGRIDLRNHRKIVVIDNRITYCGSQNCADPEFRIKPKFAPWVDILVRLEGPVVQQNQLVFASDWMTYVEEDIRQLIRLPCAGATDGFIAQVIATGPTGRGSAMPETFIAVMHAARRQLTITTPYFVPNEAIMSALCSAAHRGVQTTLIVPASNDSREVAAASRSYYKDLLEAGVYIHEFTAGLLHAKTITVDHEISLIGSANMDRRSFDLNYENNILLHDKALTRAIMERQQEYVESSEPVTLDSVSRWSIGQRLKNNVMGMLGPVL